MNTGFVNFHVGGTGLASAPVIRDLWLADKQAVPLYTVLVDTETTNQRLLDDGTVDEIISLCLSPKKINAVLATPQSFGDTAARIVERLGKLLAPSSLGNGARTVRSLAQFMFEIRRDAIASQINRCLIRFRHQYGCQQFIPVFHTSSGGGTGSALTILLACHFMTQDFRSRVLQGLDNDSLGAPFAFVVEPFFRAAAHTDDPIHTAKILGNAMAFRIESAECERRGFFNYIYHLGLSSSGGAVLDSEREVARVLGTSVYLFEKHYELQIKNRTVDRAEIHRLFSSYLGHDVYSKMPRSKPAAAVLPATQPTSNNHRVHP